MGNCKTHRRDTKQLAATIEILREILTAIPDDLVGLHDRALLLLGFAGALRRGELAAVRVEHLAARERGLSLTLQHSEGERTGRPSRWRSPTAPPPSVPGARPAPLADRRRHHRRALFRRIFVPPTGTHGGQEPRPGPVVGTEAIDPGSVGQILKQRAAAAGFDPDVIGGHSLKRGAQHRHGPRHPSHPP